MHICGLQGKKGLLQRLKLIRMLVFLLICKGDSEKICLMKKGVTIKDIARKLNMSVSTVSKALNNDLSISTPTKERVKQLANDWNYIPNEAARHFKLNKTFTLGLVIPDMLDQFFVLAINGAEKIAATEK